MRLTTPPLPPLPSLPLSPCPSGHLPGASGETEQPTGARGPSRGRRWGRADRGQPEPTPDCHDSYRTRPEGSRGGGGRGDRTAAAVGHTQAPHHLQVLLCLLPEPPELHSLLGGAGMECRFTTRSTGQPLTHAPATPFPIQILRSHDSHLPFDWPDQHC